MKTLITALLITFSFTIYAQNPDDLIGKWKFHDVYQKEKIDSTGLKMLEMFFGKMTLQFNKNGLYKAEIMGRTEQGQWTLEKDKTITIASDKGHISKLELIDLGADKMSFKMEKSAFIMQKTKEAEMDELVEKEKNFKTVKATTEQIAKKWYLKNKETSEEVSEEMKETVMNMLKGSYLDITPNGKYEIQVLKIKDNGKWEFGQGNESIITMNDDTEKVWNIVAVSENELVLIQGLTNERWTFSSVE